MNRWRSPTAEKIYSGQESLDARSAGISKSAVHVVSASDLQWADIIFAMEQKHLSFLASRFPGEMRHKESHVLDIPDEYRFMDAELITEISTAVDSILLRPRNGR